MGEKGRVTIWKREGVYILEGEKERGGGGGVRGRERGVRERIPIGRITENSRGEVREVETEKQ